MLLPLDDAAAYRAVAGRDPRWDGRLYLGVSTTGIYCRPSCPARTPRPENCRYFPTAAAAVAAGFRACRRCRPDALPGTRAWDQRGDLVARAVQLIAQGVVDTDGVEGLARRLAVSERHLHRMLRAEVGAGALELARTRRAHAARTLIDQTTMPLAEIAFAAGFGSIRQFNEVMLAEFGATPSALRSSALRSSALRSPGNGPAKPGSSRHSPSTPRGRSADDAHAATREHSLDNADDGRTGVGLPTITLRLAYRPPLAAGALRRTLAAHVIEGVEHVTATGEHHRVVDAAAGPALVTISLPGTTTPAASTPVVPFTPVPASATPRPAATSAHLRVTIRLTALSDLMAVVTAVRRWLDLDADPGLVDEHLGADPLLAQLVHSRPGLRVPGAIDGAEFAVCAVLGQQVSLAAARRFQSRIALAFGNPLTPGTTPESRWPETAPATSPATMASPAAIASTSAGHPQSAVAPPDAAAPAAPIVAVPAPRTFPRPETLAAAGPQAIRDAAHLTQARARTVHAVAEACAGGLELSPGVDVTATRARLLALPGVGPWTTDFITLRALRDPDAFVPGDLVLRKALARATGAPLRELTAARAHALAEAWRPWRSYALHHLWTTESYS